MGVFGSSIIVVGLLVSLVLALPAKDADRSDADYCKKDPEHTMCVTKGAYADGMSEDGVTVWKAPSGCNIKYRTLNKVGRDAALGRLNERRNAVAGGEVAGQPAVANMKLLVWNDELEMIAQRWADQCHTGEDIHDAGHNLKLDGSTVGQNAFVGSYWRQVEAEYDDYDYKLVEDQDRKIWWDNNGLDHITPETRDDIEKHLGDFTDAWYNEVKDFDQHNIKPFRGNDATGHYTQDVWAETDEVGCGMVFFSNTVQPNAEREFYTGLMLCNFSPMGNIEGARMDEVGTPHSDCGVGYSKDANYTNLCSKN